MQNTVGIDVESDLDLRNAAGSWWNAIQTEAAKRHIITCHWALALQDVYINSGLVISGG